MAALLAASATGLLPTGASGKSDDELDPSQDNPPGCRTATSGSDRGCGAQGRNHFNDAGHMPPIKACAPTRSAAGSLVTRVLPKGPTLKNGTLAFTSGVCIYLPPGYENSGLRYSVLYLLHGGGGDQAAWVSLGKVQATLDAHYAKDKRNALIAVMPDGTDAQWYDSYDKTLLVETYFFDYVVPYIDRHYRTIADRRGRAIDGLSNGGFGALHFAAKAPDRFIAAGAMSGNLGARTFGGLGTPLFSGGPAFQEAGAHYYGSVPAELAINLDPVDMTIDWGASCSGDIAVDLCATWAFEQSFRLDNQYFRDQLVARKYTGTYEYRETEGSHAWRWWGKWLDQRHLPFFWKRLSPPEHANKPVRRESIPPTFRYRSVSPVFSVFGYLVSVERPAKEFLDLNGVTAKGMTVRGSGKVTITTAARYAAGRSYSVVREKDSPLLVRADHAGRLRFAVDLGPGHKNEQYSLAGRMDEQNSSYWTERKVTISPA